MSRYNSMSKKVDLNKLSPQELLAYAQNLVKQSEKVKQPPNQLNPKNLSQLNHLQNYHKYCHLQVKYLIIQKKLYQ